MDRLSTASSRVVILIDQLLAIVEKVNERIEETTPLQTYSPKNIWGERQQPHTIAQALELIEQAQAVVERRKASLVRATAKRERIPTVFAQSGFEGIALVGAGNLESLRQSLEPVIMADRGCKCLWQSLTPVRFEVRFPGGRTYTNEKLVPADVDRIAQSSIEQCEFLKRVRDLEVKGLLSRGTPNHYQSLDEFRVHAEHCVVGFDAFYNRMSIEEEVQRCFCTFKNAARARILAFGRGSDASHSGAHSQFSYTNEYHCGGIEQMERWTLCLNYSWILGAIKAGRPFVTVTDYMSLSRKDLANVDRVPPKMSDDFRNDNTEVTPIQRNVPLHTVATISMSEIPILIHCGYQVIPDPIYGKKWIPEDTEAFRSRRAALTIIDVKAFYLAVKTTLAIANVTGETRLSDEMLNFLRLSDPSDDDKANFARHLARMKEGVSLEHPMSLSIRRTDKRIIDALGELTSAGVLVSEKLLRKAVQEISNAVMYTAEPEIKDLDYATQQAIRFRIFSTISNDLQRGVFKVQEFTLGDVERVKSFLRGCIPSRDAHVIEEMSQLFETLKPALVEAVNTNSWNGSPFSRQRFSAEDVETVTLCFAHQLAFEFARIGGSDKVLAGKEILESFLRSFEFIPGCVNQMDELRVERTRQ